MKKAILILCAFIMLPFTPLKADIVIEGTHTTDSLLFGVLIVNCKDSHETCVIIRSSGTTTIANVPELGDEWFSIEYYETKAGIDGTHVQLYGVE
jgi:hypothetical protein